MKPWSEHKPRVSAERLTVRAMLVEFMRAGAPFTIRELYKAALAVGGDWHDAEYTRTLMRQAGKIGSKKTGRACVWQWKEEEMA